MSDAERLFEIYSDRETMKFMGGGPQTVDDERGALQRHREIYYDLYGFGLWGVVLKSENKLLGRCGIIKQEIEGETMEEISYLIDREYWNKGYVTEAAKAVVEVAREKYRLKKLIALILPENVGSIRVAEKCGFELERMLEVHKIWNNVGLYARML